jgi:hypothetical protein
VAQHGNLESAADRVLESAWVGERRRALARLVASTLGRVAVFVLGLGALVGVVRLALGVDVPSSFFAVMSGLALAAAWREVDRAHLRHEGDLGDGAGRHRPSTGCYPGGGGVDDLE